MATFKMELQREKKDGTRNIKIILTHERKLKRLPTNIYITKSDLTRSGKLKNQSIINKVDDIIKEYRDRCNSFATKIDGMSIDKLSNLLIQTSDNINLIEVFNDYIEENKEKGGTVNYRCALNSLKKYLNRDYMDILDININFLNKFGEYLGDGRKLTLYMGCLRHVYSYAKLKYNDEDSGTIRIPYSPFNKYKFPKQQETRKRAIGAELIKKIYDLPYKTRNNERREVMQYCRYNLAKDMFILSFCLIGINSADLYYCDKIENGEIIYFRQKTKTRRADHAEIHVKIQKIVKEIFKKYTDRSKKRIFNFYTHYRDTNTFNQAINRGLKEIGAELGIEDLEYYAARHSWATIAINEVKIDKYTVHSALNHVDDNMRVTDIYIKKDFSDINDANRKVLKYVFGK